MRLTLCKQASNTAPLFIMHVHVVSWPSLLPCYCFLGEPVTTNSKRFVL